MQRWILRVWWGIYPGTSMVFDLSVRDFANRISGYPIQANGNRQFTYQRFLFDMVYTSDLYNIVRSKWWINRKVYSIFYRWIITIWQRGFLHINKKIQWSPVRNWDFQQSLYGIYAYENGYYERMDMAIRMHAIVMVSSLYNNGIWCDRYGTKISESDKSSDVVVIEPLVRNLLHSHACTDCSRVFCDAVCTNIYVRSDLHNNKRICCCYDIAGWIVQENTGNTICFGNEIKKCLQTYSMMLGSKAPL